MSDRVLDVVNGFNRLTPEEKTTAFLEIEEAWRTLQNTPDTQPSEPPRARERS